MIIVNSGVTGLRVLGGREGGRRREREREKKRDSKLHYDTLLHNSKVHAPCAILHGACD